MIVSMVTDNQTISALTTFSFKILQKILKPFRKKFIGLMIEIDIIANGRIR